MSQLKMNEYRKNFIERDENGISEQKDIFIYNAPPITARSLSSSVESDSKIYKEKCQTLVTAEATTGDEYSTTEGTSARVTSFPSLTTAIITCPLTKCGKIVGVRSLLSHCLRDHLRDFSHKELKAAQPFTLEIDVNLLKFRENTCLGVIAYGGNDTTPGNSPAVRGVCMPNVWLWEKHKHLSGHLPILIMACLTGIPAMYENADTLLDLVDQSDKRQHVLVIWLVTIEIPKPIYCTISVYDKLMTTSRSSIVQVRCINDSQNVSKFLPTEVHMLRLTGGDIKMLTQGYNKTIQLEIIIKEYDVTQKC